MELVSYASYFIDLLLLFFCGAKIGLLFRIAKILIRINIYIFSFQVPALFHQIPNLVDDGIDLPCTLLVDGYLLDFA